MTAKTSRHFSLANLLFGLPLRTADIPHQTISKKIGLAVFASDALSSSAYAIDEILIVLILAGAGALGLSLPIALAIIVLLVILTLSYEQTIHAYPGGGGAYIVARDNLGEAPAQTAGAALLTDYILTVAVSISSGAAQITSAFPELYPWRTSIALVFVAFVTIVNLRGVRESGRVFAIPTYFFLGMVVLTIGIGFFRYFAGTLGSVTGVEAIHHESLQALTLFLVLRAFSGGCTALTGVEAISNGITAFKEPRSRNAGITLMWMSGIIAVNLFGLTFLANQVGVLPSHVETGFSQIGRAVYGEASPLYLMLLGATTLILVMAANTSYADFPRLGALHAGDGFLPKQLTWRGRRLVFSWGIVTLAGVASLLIVIFNSETTRLIPLYAIGVFLSFTMSQTGMVVRWHRVGKMKPGEELEVHGAIMRFDPRWRAKQIVNGIGALVTFVVMIVFAITKFADGAWIVVIVIPALVYTFFRIHHHYGSVAQILSQGSRWPNIRQHPVKTLVLVDDVHAGTIHTINFAKSLGVPWTAVHVAIDPAKAEQVRQKWQERIGNEAHLTLLPSPYRSLTDPIHAYVEKLLEDMPNGFIHIIVGHLVMDKLREQALHQNAALVLNLALQDLDRATVTTVSYRIVDRENGKGRKRGISVT